MASVARRRHSLAPQRPVVPPPQLCALATPYPAQLPLLADLRLAWTNRILYKRRRRWSDEVLEAMMLAQQGRCIRCPLIIGDGRWAFELEHHIPFDVWPDGDLVDGNKRLMCARCSSHKTAVERKRQRYFYNAARAFAAGRADTVPCWTCGALVSPWFYADYQCTRCHIAELLGARRGPPDARAPPPVYG